MKLTLCVVAAFVAVPVTVQLLEMAVVTKAVEPEAFSTIFAPQPSNCALVYPGKSVTVNEAVLPFSTVMLVEENETPSLAEVETV